MPVTEQNQEILLIYIFIYLHHPYSQDAHYNMQEFLHCLENWIRSSLALIALKALVPYALSAKIVPGGGGGGGVVSWNWSNQTEDSYNIIVNE